MRFVFGIVVGVTIGLLCAPAEGAQTRRRLYRTLREFAKAPRLKVADLVEEKKERAGDVGARLGRKATESAVERVAERLRKDEGTV